MNNIKELLNDLYFSLNPALLDDLKNYTIRRAAELKEDGVIYNSYTLEKLIDKYASKYPADQELVKYVYELKDNNSISAMVEYYDLIDYLMQDIDI